ncbi:MAG: DUF2917 domain-containing protein [Rhodocyclaceae bacterium]|nr:DUF2917 domain-containing protein [Rhodocyclaceae bacterium]
MNAQNAWNTLLVPGGTSRLLEHAAGVELQCRSGSAWITQLGDDRDVVLTSGRSVVLSLPTAIVMTSRAGATLSYRPAGPQHRPGGWLKRVLGLFDPRWSGAAARSLRGRVRRAAP